MLQNLRTDLKSKHWNENDAPTEMRWKWLNIFTSSKRRTKQHFYSPWDVWCLPAPSWTKPEERECVVDSRASMHKPSRKHLSSLELETIKVSRNLTTAFTAKGELQTNEEAAACVFDLDLFVTIQILEDTPAVLSLSKLCEDHGYSDEWTSGQKPHLINHGRKYIVTS